MRFVHILAVAMLLGIAPALVQAGTESVIYDFDDPVFPATGCSATGDNGDLQARAGLLFHQNHLYGTVPSGGAGVKGEPETRDGIAFKLALPQPGQTKGVRKIVHSFSGSPVIQGGTYPCSRLIRGAHGVFYGTTTGGGAFNWGTVFQLTPPPKGQNKGWTESTVYSFQGFGDGGQPADGLVLDDLGNLYGTTPIGGVGSGLGNGTVFQLTPPHNGVPGWTKTTIYEFNSLADGYYPNGDLLFEPTGFLLFGTTLYGGQFGAGTVYQLSLPPFGQTQWTKTTLWNFDESSPLYAAANPNGGLIGGTGALFGTTQNGGISGTGGCCGIVFFLWQETAGNLAYTLVTLHQFAGGSDGIQPWAGLFQDASGTFWGTTTLGGTNNNGTVFKLVPDGIRAEVWDYSVAYRFLGGPNDGADPEGALTSDGKGNLYGTTNSGGAAGLGTVFRVTP
jgi:uncharacterized repeat protein (TIGR03803 family)